MNKLSYSQELINRYTDARMENSKIIHYNDKQNLKSEVYFYDELNNIEVKGFPFASDFADNNGNAIDYSSYVKLSKEEKSKYRLRFHYLPLMHEIVIGTTGSGKTTSCIEPQIRALSSQKNKPNIFISDPKGELFLHNVSHLKDNGYNVQVLNFKDVQHSNCWNPLEEAYVGQIKAEQIGKDVKFIKGNIFDHSLSVYGDLSEFTNDYHLICDGNVFPSYRRFKEYVESKKFLAKSKVSVLVNQICFQMFPEDPYEKDKTWVNGAREFFHGIMLALLDDAINPKKHFTKEMFNIKTLNDVYTLVQKCDDENSQNEKEKLENFMKGKPKEAVDKITIVSKTAPATRKGYLSVAQSMIGKWMNGHVFSLTTKTDIVLDDSDKPIALFVITRDYDKSDNTVAGLFLNWVYRYFLEKAEKQERINGISGGRPIHFLLDEFANIPQIPDFEIKIATSRSRNIWFHIYIQSYEQLDVVYPNNISRIIVDNCNQQVFLGSQSYNTKEKFSKECGSTTIESIETISLLNERKSETMPLLPMSTLDNIDPGWMYIKRIRSNVIYSCFVRSYQCANEGIFKNFYNATFTDNAPLNTCNPNDDCYRYVSVIPDEFLEDVDKDVLSSRQLVDFDYELI